MAVTWRYRCPSLMLLGTPCEDPAVSCLCRQLLMVTGCLLRPVSLNTVFLFLPHLHGHSSNWSLPGPALPQALSSWTAAILFLGAGPTSEGSQPLGHLSCCALVLIPVVCQEALVRVFSPCHLHVLRPGVSTLVVRSSAPRLSPPQPFSMSCL